MSTKHTPGPWIAKKQCPASGWVDVVTKSSDDDESLPFVACKHFNEVANARLIAAAPDLMDALKYMLEVCPAINGQGEEAHHQARAAIAKAEGQQ